jgi:hypothetical protein
MAQGAGISLGKITFAAAALGVLLLLLASAVHGDDRGPPHPLRSGAGGALLVDDDCQSFTDVPPLPAPPQAMTPRVSWHRAPAVRAIPAVWTEYRGPQQPLRGTGSDWIFVPFDGCTGIDTGDFDLRNPSGEEAVRGTHSIAIGFRAADPPCAPAATAVAARPCALKPARPAFIVR